MNKREELEKLCEAANIAVKAYAKERMDEVPFRRGGVNWSDLRCSNAEHVESIHEAPHFRVTIEEAAPDEWDLQSAIGDRLAEMGFPYIEVVTEW